jgi:hypothetical protein
MLGAPERDVSSWKVRDERERERCKVLETARLRVCGTLWGPNETEE